MEGITFDKSGNKVVYDLDVDYDRYEVESWFLGGDYPVFAYLDGEDRMGDYVAFLVERYTIDELKSRLADYEGEPIPGLFETDLSTKVDGIKEAIKIKEENMV